MYPGANTTESDPTILGGPQSRSSTRRRNPMACLLCRRRKIKCEFNNGPEVCDHCRSKNTKCTVLSVAQEEVVKTLGYTDEILASLSSVDLESLQRRLSQQQHNSIEHTEHHPTARFLHNNHGVSSSSHHSLPSTGQDRSHYDHCNRSAPSQLPQQQHNTAEHTEPHLTARVPHNNHGPPSSPYYPLSSTGQGMSRPYNNSAYSGHTASHTGPANLATVSINTPQPQVHAHHQSSNCQNYSIYTSPSPDHQVPYQIPATGDPSVPHHRMADFHQRTNLNIPTNSNVVQNQDRTNYSGQTGSHFQSTQQPNQGQMTQYPYGGYSHTMAPGYTDDLWTPRR